MSSQTKGLPWWLSGKESADNTRAPGSHGFNPWEYPLEKGTTAHSSILTWRIPWSAEPGQLQSMRQTWLKWLSTLRQKNKSKRNKWNCIKQKKKKQTTNKTKEQTTIYLIEINIENFQLDHTTQHQKAKWDTKKWTTQLKNGQRTWKHIFPKKTYRWPTDTW